MLLATVDDINIMTLVNTCLHVYSLNIQINSMNEHFAIPQNIKIV